MATHGPLYMGFDLSTQQLKGLCVDADLKLQFEAKVDFDTDLGKYGIEKGVLTNPDEGEVFAPPAMWLDAVNLVLDRLKEQGLDFGRVRGLSGAGMQHGTVFWSSKAGHLLAHLDPTKNLAAQLASSLDDLTEGAFAHPVSPNWQDASTQEQCDAFDAELGNGDNLAQATGSKAHHRFSGPQIMRYRTKHASHYQNTARISLVSSFLASVFLGKFAPIDISDVTGANLWNIHESRWDQRLLALTAGGEDKAAELEARLGTVASDGGATFGCINPYFIKRYGFHQDCQIIPFTGDNPATILALPLRQNDAMVSLGTSTTFLMSTSTYHPDPAYHFMNHPTTSGLYMFMLCYKNGGLAREQVRNAINNDSRSTSWEKFNQIALATLPLAETTDNKMRLGLYFPRHEIVPNLKSGQWRFLYDPETQDLSQEPLTSNKDFISEDARNIIESQMLSLRLRSHSLVTALPSTSDGEQLPAQPRRVYLVGGGSANPAIARLCGEILGGVEGVFKLDIGGNACALGAAYKAVWGCERKPLPHKNGDEGTSEQFESFESFIEKRWDEEKFVVKVAEGYQKGVFEKYGMALQGFEKMEKYLLEQEGELKGQITGGQVFANTKVE